MQVRRVEHQQDGDNDRDAEHGKIDEVLSLESDRALRQKFLQFSRGHQASGERERTENHFHGKYGHHEFRNIGSAQIKFSSTNERDAKGAESMAERRSLWNSSHLHAA